MPGLHKFIEPELLTAYSHRGDQHPVLKKKKTLLFSTLIVLIVYKVKGKVHIHVFSLVISRILSTT